MAEKTIEQVRADIAAREQARLDERLKKYPTEHPHLLHLRLNQGVTVKVECPGPGHCGFRYDMGSDGMGCGLEFEAREMGAEFLEYQVGPEYTLAEHPVKIGFTWTYCGDEEPSEIEWWVLPSVTADVPRREADMERLEPNDSPMAGPGLADTPEFKSARMPYQESRGGDDE